MSHERQQIREAIVTQLTGSSPFETAAEDRVTKGKRAPHRVSKLPAISVYTEDETSEISIGAPRELKRTVPVAVDGWVSGSSEAEIEDKLDDLALEIETAMDSDAYLAGKAGDSWLASTELAVQIDGERPLGLVHMVYTVEYRTNERIAAEGDTFDTVDAKYEDLDGEAPKIHADNQAEDLIEDINEE